MTGWVQHILTMPTWLVLLVVFAMPGLESSAFVGFVFPGELALILGGVVASQGHVPLAAVIAAAILGSAIGDSVGYYVGRRYGQRLLEGRLGRLIEHLGLEPARAYLARRGSAAVFLGRFTATLRVLIPGLAGMAGMPYRRFLVANVASALTWAPMSVMFGYVAGASWQHVKHLASGLGIVAFGLLAVVLIGGHLLRKRRGPAAEESAQESSSETGPPTHRPRASSEPMHVLLADDEQRLVDLVSAYLRDQGIATDTAYDGTSALDATHRLDPDAVVLDVMMPGLSGLDVLRTLRAEGNGVPVVMLSARGAVAERDEGLRAGADAYLVKPVAMDDLHRTLVTLDQRHLTPPTP